MKIFLNPLAKLGVFIQLSNEQSLTFSFRLILIFLRIQFILYRLMMKSLFSLAGIRYLCRTF